MSSANLQESLNPKPLIEGIAREPPRQFLRENLDIFAWSNKDLPGVPKELCEHSLHVRAGAKPVDMLQTYLLFLMLHACFTVIPTCFM